MGRVNYLRRFISNLAGKTKEFFDLVKLKDLEEFRWEERHQAAFDKRKDYFSKHPVLMLSIQGHQLKLYLSIANESIGYRLAQNNSKGHKQVVNYLSRVLNPIEIRYTPIEKSCLALYFACTKLRHYLIKSGVYVVS